MTQRELSIRTGINQSTINRYERGDIVSHKDSVLTSIAEETNTTVNWLLYGSEKNATVTENDDKLIFTPRRFCESRNVRVRLEDDAAEIVNSLWLRTGLSATYIVSRMIEFAAERVEIEKTAFDDEE